MATPSCHRMLACSGGVRILRLASSITKDSMPIKPTKTEVMESEQQIPGLRQLPVAIGLVEVVQQFQIPGLRTPQIPTPSCIGLVEVEQQFAIPNPRSTVTSNPRSTATPSCHRIGGSWAAIPNPRFTATPNPRSTATPNPRSTATPNLRSTASLNPRSAASLNPSLRQLQIPGLRHV